MLVSPYKCVKCVKEIEFLSCDEQLIDKEIICLECLEKMKEEETFSMKYLVSYVRECWHCIEKRNIASFKIGGSKWPGNKKFLCRECFIRLLIFQYDTLPAELILLSPDGFKGWNWADPLIKKYLSHGSDLKKAFGDEPAI